MKKKHKKKKPSIKLLLVSAPSLLLITTVRSARMKHLHKPPRIFLPTTCHTHPVWKRNKNLA